MKPRQPVSCAQPLATAAAKDGANSVRILVVLGDEIRILDPTSSTILCRKRFFYSFLLAGNISAILANFDQKPERFTKAIYGISALEIRIDRYLWGSFKTFQVLKDLAREPFIRCRVGVKLPNSGRLRVGKNDFGTTFGFDALGKFI